MRYQRVIPRDLFNEGKLLKCLGQLSLMIHDGVRWPLNLRHNSRHRGFIIEQDESDGGLFCVNLTLSLNGRTIVLRSSYNSKSAYPLLFFGEDELGDVFQDNGEFSEEFCRYLDKQSDS